MTNRYRTDHCVDEEPWTLTANEVYDRVVVYDRAADRMHPAETQDLLNAAEVAKILIYNVVHVADEQNDVAFFAEALTEWPAVVEAVIRDCELHNRDEDGERIIQEDYR
jgi:hypothetical protein